MSEKGNVFLYFENIEDKLKSNIECFCVLKAIKIGLLIGNVSLHSSFYIFFLDFASVCPKGTK